MRSAISWTCRALTSEAAAGTTMSTGEQGEAQMQPRRASERRASVELSAELVDAARTRRASERRSSLQLIGELMGGGSEA